MPDKVTKPQSPIRNGDEGIYPLTTYDQIIMPDGSRWNGVVVEDGMLDPNRVPVVDMEGTPSETVVPINAQTLDGLTYKQIIELEHGIGSFYFTLNAADDPNNKWNWMTWELVTDKFLLGAGNLYEGGIEGGEASVILTNSNMPQKFYANVDEPDSLIYKKVNLVSTDTDGAYWITAYGDRDQPHNNMPPYLSIFMWTRVA